MDFQILENIQWTEQKNPIQYTHLNRQSTYSRLWQVDTEDVFLILWMISVKWQTFHRLYKISALADR